MSINRISIEITEAQKTAVKDATATLRGATKDFNIVISKEEIKNLPKIADGRLPFVEKALELSISNPEFNSPTADVSEFQKDFGTFKTTREMVRPVRQIADNLENTMYVSGSESWYAALNYYNSVKYQASIGVPGAQTIYDTLRPLFDYKTGTQPTEPVS